MPDLGAGEELPLLWHWLYLLEPPATADLGLDGHPVRGTIPAPPGPGRRRMWAGGRITHLEGLRCGTPATRRTSLVKSVDKHGRSGPVTFVTVRHQISQDGRVALEEEQDIVYRNAVAPTPPRTTEATQDKNHAASSPVSVTDVEWEVATPVTLLFRFSALTYNAHRIHYDRDYARDVEGYTGLVVHGPLQVILMAEAVRRHHPAMPRGTRFSYRLMTPVFDHEGLVISTSVATPDTQGQSDPTEVSTRDLLTGVRSANGHASATGMDQSVGTPAM